MEDMAMVVVMVEVMVVAMGLNIVEDTTMEAMVPDMVVDMVALDMVVGTVNLGMEEAMAEDTAVAMAEDMAVAVGIVGVEAMEAAMAVVATLVVDIMVDGIKRCNHVCFSIP